MRFPFFRFAVAATISTLLAASVFAANHDVGEGGQLPPTATLATSDTITLTGNPALLTAVYDLGAKAITIASDSPSAWRTLSHGAAAGANARILAMTGGGTWAFDNIIFTGGKPTGSTTAAQGGAMFIAAGTGTTVINGAFTVSNNVSQLDGGGIYAAGALSLTGPVLFQSNTTSAPSGNVAGGAIYAGGNLSIAGSSTFAYNTALRPNGNTAGGGAIFVFGNNSLTLNASAGDITFIGNMAGGTPNAIHMRNQSNNSAVLTLNTGAGASAHTIYFYDPITAQSAAPLVQNGNGTVVYDTYASTFAANSSINSGTMKLTRGAIYGYNATTGTFTLAAPATLSGNGTVRANVINLVAGSTLEVLGGGTLTLTAGATRTFGAGLNLGGYGVIDAGAALNTASVTVGTLTPGDPGADTLATRAAQTLTLGATAPLTIADGGRVNISIFAGGSSDLLATSQLTLTGSAYINLVGGGGGNYHVMTSGVDLSAYDDGRLVALINGSAPTARYTSAFSFQNAGADMWVNLDSKNLGTTWTGNAGGLWKSAANDATWTDGSSGNTDYTFLNGDHVTFGDSASVKNVTIDTDSVAVSEMIVNHTTGAYAFAGAGGITASSTVSFGTVVTATTGKLIKTGAGTLNFINAGANTFQGGIELGGGEVGFTNGAQLGDGGKGIAITDDITLRANADAQTLANNITLAANKTATLATGANTLTLSGSLTGDSATALSKTGSGILNLSGNGDAFAGVTNIQQGSLLLAGNAQLGGTVNIAAGATFGGAGGATGGVVSALGGILQIGADLSTSATLTINTLTVNSTILRFDLFSSGTNDRLIVTNPAITIVGVVATNIIDINSGVTGTFNLGNIAALNGAQVTIDGMAQATNSRSVATTSTNSGNLILTAGADISRVMYWTGSDDALWNNTNWTDNGAKDLSANGDRVIFNGTTDAAHATNRAITVVVPVTVSDMLVQGAASYTFTGETITTDAASLNTGTALSSGTGKLVKTGAGTLAFENTANNFKGGIDHGGGVIAFDSGAQLTAGGAGITFTDSATLRPDADTALATSIRINTGVTAVIDTAAHSLLYTGTLAAADTTAALSKTGTAYLGLAADNSAYTGQIAINAGGLLLTSSTAKLGGVTTVNANTTFGGIGSAATVNALASSTVAIDPGALTIAALNLDNGAALTGNGTLLGNATLLGDVTADIDTARQLTLGGTTGGTGALIKTGAGTLVYSGNASLGHTAPTNVHEGIVALENIADTAALAHTFNLEGGALALSLTGTLNQATASNWPNLAINTGSAGGTVMGANDRLTYATGGTIAYNIGGSTAAQQGLFVIVDAHNNTVTFTGTNTYRGSTRLDSGTLSLTGNNQLGAIPGTVILNGGVLQLQGSGITVAQIVELRTDATIDAPFAGSAGKAITGPITKTSSIPVTLTIANSNYITVTATSTIHQYSALSLNSSNAADALVVEPYINVTARHIAAAGTGTAIISEHSTFTYSALTGTVANNFTGHGTLGIAASNITLTGASNIVFLTITGASESAPSTVTAASPDALGGFDSVITGSNARIILAAPVNNFGSVTFSSGAGYLGFHNDGAYKQARVTTLYGGGILAFNTNIAGGAGDRIDIARNLLGSYTIVINDTGAQPADPSQKLDIIKASLGSATLTLSNTQGYVDAGIHAYTLQAVSASDGYTVSLVNAPGQYSTAVSIAKSMAGAMPLSWFSELDSVTSRMGEVRLNDTATSKNLTTWLRGWGRHFNVGDKPTGLAFGEQQFGADTGADFKALDAGFNIFIGAFVGYGQAVRDFGAPGDARSDSAYAGAYVTISNSAGWYLDAAVKGNRFKNRVNAVDTSGNPLNASFSNNGAGASLEGGKYITFSNGWFVEPQLQGQYVAVSGQNYTISNGIGVSVDRAASAQARAGLIFGRLLVNNGHDHLHASVKLHGARQWVTGGRVHANDRYVGNPKIEGGRIEAGVGLAWTVAQVTQLYLDYQCANSEDYTKPYSINLGVRHSW